jgi:hypothetical protein
MVEKEVSYILGIVSLVIAFFSPFAGIILGAIGLNHNKNQKGELAKKAKILNILGIIVGSIYLLVILAFLIIKGYPNLI